MLRKTLLRSSHCVYAVITFFPLALRLILIGKIGEKFWTCSKFLADLKYARFFPVLTTLVLRYFRLQTIPVRFCRSPPICWIGIDRDPNRDSGMVRELCFRYSIQCVPEEEKKETHKSSLFFWKLWQSWFIRNNLHCYKILYPLSFDTSYKMYWPCMAKHEPFQMVMSKLTCAE